MVTVNKFNAQVLLTSGRIRTQLVQWWDSGGSTKKYVACSIALLQDDDGNEYHLAWPHSYSAEIDLTWVSETKEITFQKIKGVKHVALLCSCKKTVLTHWITGNRPGQTLTRFDVNDSCPDEGGGNALEIAPNGGANWVGGNTYKVGETVYGKTALFTGGIEPITYRWRMQTKEAGGGWGGGPWNNVTNDKVDISHVLKNKPGVKYEVRLQSQAREDNAPNAIVNSFTGGQNVVD